MHILYARMSMASGRGMWKETQLTLTHIVSARFYGQCARIKADPTEGVPERSFQWGCIVDCVWLCNLYKRNGVWTKAARVHRMCPIFVRRSLRTAGTARTDNTFRSCSDRDWVNCNRVQTRREWQLLNKCLRKSSSQQNTDKHEHVAEPTLVDRLPKSLHLKIILCHIYTVRLNMKSDEVLTKWPVSIGHDSL